MSNDRPKQDRTADGRRIVYPIWRDDLAEATIFPIEKKETHGNDRPYRKPQRHPDTR